MLLQSVESAPCFAQRKRAAERTCNTKQSLPAEHSEGSLTSPQLAEAGKDDLLGANFTMRPSSSLKQKGFHLGTRLRGLLFIPPALYRMTAPCSAKKQPRVLIKEAAACEQATQRTSLSVVHQAKTACEQRFKAHVPARCSSPGWHAGATN